MDRWEAALDRLVGREVERILDDLARAHPRELADNPEGVAFVAEAVREALRLGLDAGCRRAGLSASELDLGRPDAWERWQRERALTPAGRTWPAVLAAFAPDGAARARTLLTDAGRELGLRRRALADLGHAGAQAAEAGAALARALTSEPARVTEAPEAATGAPLGAPQPDGTVRVAVAANQSEAELLQGVLADAGIPSTWRRTGGDLPQLLAAGYREIYVPAAAAEEGQALLATLEAPRSGQEPAPTRPIGLERTGLRLIGKVAAALIVVSLLAGAVLSLVPAERAVGIAVVLVLGVAAAALVVWSERSA
jgi:hypothetical protein